MQAIDDAKPDAIFNVLFGPDLAKFVREGNTRGVFKDRFVASLLSGEPEYIDPLKDEAPVGWLVTGYPWYAISLPDHQTFLPPTRRSSTTIRGSARWSATSLRSRSPRGITKAGSTDPGESSPRPSTASG